MYLTTRTTRYLEIETKQKEKTKQDYQCDCYQEKNRKFNNHND